ncbi:sodium ion-translocating decarboxylase subunit beta [Alkaliphilus serpentinus]|uniref:Sodium ion-translocating decarboxylase subunit beta n=1 Tax=Alkaliphilus serpentinus TaxID=1482731 RepID=A0A833HNB1_9FIRM|nr:sodium ion-translocating decarboxylase subunit beta [Alkaliphilus serpentinus]KAB3529325.1 sodium ion-translocating decarboxylase subunit beta [Alkaliphilus serpentinus]
MFNHLLAGVYNLNIQQVGMYIIGGILIYLAIKKDYEPMLLLPIGFGAILTNIPVIPGVPGIASADGVLGLLKEAGIMTELFPALIFIAIGAMMDFGPLLSMPSMLFFGAAAQFGIFATLLVALALGFDIKDAASIGIIGAADGPTSIFVASRFSPRLFGAISVAAYSYMSLVPIIQPKVIKLLTSSEERKIKMKYKSLQISKTVRILFPILVTIIAGIIAPMSVTLIGLLMFGNLIRESGVLQRLSNAAQNELSNLVTLLLGITIGATMDAANFITLETGIIMLLGLVAFIFDTAGGVLFAKFLNLFVKDKYNPMVGAAGISAFPMSSRVIQKLAKEEDPHNFILMQAASANVAGQIGSIIAGSVIIALLSQGGF